MVVLTILTISLCMDFTQTFGQGLVQLGVVLVEVTDELLAVTLLGILGHTFLHHKSHLFLADKSAGTYREDAQQRVVAHTLHLQGLLRQSSFLHTHVESTQTAGVQDVG